MVHWEGFASIPLNQQVMSPCLKLAWAACEMRPAPASAAVLLSGCCSRSRSFVPSSLSVPVFVFLHVQFCKAKSRRPLSQLVHLQRKFTVSCPPSTILSSWVRSGAIQTVGRDPSEGRWVAGSWGQPSSKAAALPLFSRSRALFPILKGGFLFLQLLFSVQCFFRHSFRPLLAFRRGRATVRECRFAFREGRFYGVTVAALPVR